MYNFDDVVDRRNTESLKYDFGMERKNREDLLPLWVADMDFKLPDEILSEFKKVIDRGIFGYSDSGSDYFESVHDWFFKYFGWDTKREWLIKTPGIVYAIAIAIRAYTKKGDAILIQKPVYYPFSEVIIDNERKLVNNELVLINGKYTIDFEDFEKKIVEENVKLFLLCSPQNPTGRVWTREELLKIGEICLKHDVLVLSDEIHCDFTYEGHPHIVFASLSKELSNISITCTSPTKTFNIAGFQISNIFISNETLRKSFLKQIDKTGYSQVGTFAVAGSRIVYKYGYEWLSQLRNYLSSNLEFLKDYLEENIPQVKLIEPEGTYLVWLDFSKVTSSVEELKIIIEDKAKLWLDRGGIFSDKANLFERINIACPRKILAQALEQLKEALKN